MSFHNEYCLLSSTENNSTLTESSAATTSVNLPESTLASFPGVECNDVSDGKTLNDTAVQTTVFSLDASCRTINNLQSNTPVLTTPKVSSISIPPRKIYHPAVINASKLVCNKHPSELTKEESSYMKNYLDRKREAGEPVELDPSYLPISMRNCYHCGQLT